MNANRVVFYGQWVAAVLIPLCYVIGRVWIGAGGGWLIVVGVILGPLMALLLLIPPVLTLLDPDVRAARATTDPYTTSTFVLWALGLVMIITKSDQADGPPAAIGLSAWTGLAVGPVDVLNVIVTVGFWIAWVIVVVFAVRALIARRQARSVAAAG